MSSAHLQIQQALVAALVASPAVAGGRVYTNPVREVPQAAATAVAITLVRSSAQRPTLHAADWSTTFQVECMARAASSGADPAAAVDDLLATVYARLAALTLPAGLGLMDIAVQPAIAWDYSEGTTPTVAATLLVAATHRTFSNSLEPWT